MCRLCQEKESIIGKRCFPGDLFGFNQLKGGSNISFPGSDKNSLIDTAAIKRRRKQELKDEILGLIDKGQSEEGFSTRHSSDDNKSLLTLSACCSSRLNQNIMSPG